ncbi:MAG: SEC-C metal-binding domain-containing protein [bacterium]
MSIIDKLFGKTEGKLVKKYQPLAQKINSLEKEFEGFSDAQLKERAGELKQKIQQEFAKFSDGLKVLEDSLRKTVDQDNKIKIKKQIKLFKNKIYEPFLPEAFALVRESSKRTVKLRHFDVQLVGGVILHEGAIAEMKTGEGKTLAATLAVFLNALEGKGAHIITVNDYLAKRDANWMGPIYCALGLSVGCIQHDNAFIFDPHSAPDANEVSVEMENLKPISRKEAYLCDITYGTNNEFGFDYLRDNLVLDPEQMVQRGHNFAIVDEVDSILIDEARTPLIISAPDAESSNKYKLAAERALPVLGKVRFITSIEESEAKKINTDIEEGFDIIANEERKSALLTQQGQDKCEKVLGVSGLFEGVDPESFAWKHAVDQVVKAAVFFHKDKDYVVKNGEIIIVDDFTGRLMPGRRYSEGLHQAIEAKEGVEVQKESKTVATITFQNYFRFYEKLSGMTGTAATNAEEFNKVYGLDVDAIPTNQQVVRKDFSDGIYKTEKGKFLAALEKIKQCHEKGQPVLVGTISVEKSELLSGLLEKSKIKHEILNAKNHEREAAIIAQAGQTGAVTIATNMAGRGTDIKLSDEAKNAGGLFVLGTERHEARRIDNQLRGRSGRQGDPGASQFFVSLDDDLMRIFGSDRMRGMMDKLNFPEDQPIENKILSKAIESAQAKVEGYNFDVRNHVLEYDDVMNKQRDLIYARRQKILFALGSEEEKNELKNSALELLSKEIANIVYSSAGKESKPNIPAIASELKNILDAREFSALEKNVFAESGLEFLQISEVKERLEKAILEVYQNYEKTLGAEIMRGLERFLLLRIIDTFWMQHLDYMDYLRNSVSLRSFGQRDPLVEYRKEGFSAFEKLLANIQSNFAQYIFKASFTQAQASIEKEKRQRERLRYSGGEDSSSGSAGVTVKNENKIGRNDPCPCGSGKKYKRCCGA